MPNTYTAGGSVATIASGQPDSTVFRVEAYKFGAIELPATFTGTSLAIFGGEDKNDPASFKQVYKDDGNAYGLTVAANRIVTFDVALLALAALPFVFLRSNQNEAAERALKLHLKR